MGIVIFAIAFNLFWKRIKQEKGKTVLMLLGALGFYNFFDNFKYIFGIGIPLEIWSARCGFINTFEAQNC